MKLLIELDEERKIYLEGNKAVLVVMGAIFSFFVLLGNLAAMFFV